MKILHVLSTLDASSGGPVRSVRGLSQSLTERGHISTVLAASPPPNATPLHMDAASISALNPSPLSALWKGHSFDGERKIAHLAAENDLIHIHSLWHYPGYAAAQQARKYETPTLISPRGTLQGWSLRQKRLKKAIYTHFIQRRLMSAASACHALTDTERSELEAFGVHSRIRVCPNGVTCPPLSPNDGRLFRSEFSQLGDSPFILFLGRLHPKKGVDLLLRAFLAVVRDLPEGTALVLAGPDDSGLVQQLQRQAQQSGFADRVFFTGLLDDTLKFSAMRAARFLVHPSHSEGLSLVSLEALAAGLPMVVSKRCNLDDVHGRIGLVVEPSQDELRSALLKLGRDTSDSRLQQMAVKARAEAESTYAWDKIACSMENIYGELVR